MLEERKQKERGPKEGELPPSMGPLATLGQGVRIHAEKTELRIPLNSELSLAARVHYPSTGMETASKMVFMRHGFADSSFWRLGSQMLHGLSPLVVPSGAMIVSFDSRGHGQSMPGPEKRVFPLTDAVEDFDVLFRHFSQITGLNEYAAVGHSIGGAVAAFGLTKFQQMKTAVMINAPIAFRMRLPEAVDDPMIFSALTRTWVHLSEREKIEQEHGPHTETRALYHLSEGAFHDLGLTERLKKLPPGKKLHIIASTGDKQLDMARIGKLKGDLAGTDIKTSGPDAQIVFYTGEPGDRDIVLTGDHMIHDLDRDMPRLCRALADIILK